jgi:hypothetical protein
MIDEQYKSITIEDSKQFKNKMAQGLQRLYTLAPKFYCQDMIFSFKKLQFPLTENYNVNVLQANINTHFLNQLQDHKPFSVARYNDGEWIPMLRIAYTGNSVITRPPTEYNCNNWVWGESGQKYVDDYLMPIIKKVPPYFIGISSQVYKKPYMSEQIYPHLNGMKLCDGFLFVRLSITGEMQKYFDQFKKRNVIVIGPDYCINMRKYFSFSHVQTLNNNDVWKESDRVQDEIKNLLDKFDRNENTVLIYACSYVAKKLIDDFYHEYKNITQIDMGSAVCPYSDAFVRSYSQYAPL